MSIIGLNLSRNDYMDNGLSSRQRKVYVLRWNPEISMYKPEEFLEDLEWYKAGGPVNSEKWGENKYIYWDVYDWKTVEYMDLFVMMMVGNGATGIVGAGYLHSFPLQAQLPNGNHSRKRFFKLTYMFMQDPAHSGLLTGDALCRAIPEVDWLHGHSGELITVEQAEKLALFMVGQLKNEEDGPFLHFDEFSQKKYVLSDGMTFMCPNLKRQLLSMGRLNDTDVTDINDLMVRIKDTGYQRWKNLERHLELEELNSFML